VQASSSAARRAAPDWAWRGLLGFTAVVFLRPQDQIPALELLHLADLFAVIGLSAMVTNRLQRGLPPLPLTPEVFGLLAFGAAMLVGVPFSYWPGGSFRTFIDIYLKLLAIVVLAIHALDRRERIEPFIWLIVLSASYVAGRAVIDYGRGVNLVEGDRIGGAVGGIFGNPNDLALNMVSLLPFALAFAFRPGKPGMRGAASVGALLMIATVVLTRSRGGVVGLVAMIATLVLTSLRVRPAIGAAAITIVLVSVPFAPASFWSRMSSIVNPEQDPTGSRQARIDLLKEAWRVFVEHPVTGVGLAQFVNFDPTRKEAWRVTHNVTLQVAAELGVLGLAPFLFLIARAVLAAHVSRRVLLPPPRKRFRAGARAAGGMPGSGEGDPLLTIVTGVLPALVGWFVAAQFASVAFNWTFYYLLAIAVGVRTVAARSGVAPAERALKVSA
jgi:O-antigen ligase